MSAVRRPSAQRDFIRQVGGQIAVLRLKGSFLAFSSFPTPTNILLRQDSSSSELSLKSKKPYAYQYIPIDGTNVQVWRNLLSGHYAQVVS